MNKIEKAVRMGLVLADGKDIDGAVREVLECLSLVIDVGTFAPPAPGAQSPAACLMPSVVLSAVASANPEDRAALSDLAPLAGRPDHEKKAVRVYWAPEELQELVMSQSPASMEIKVGEGALTLHRNIMQELQEPRGLILSYKPRDSNPNIPIPKASFWVTDEAPDIAGAIAKIQAAAADMYKPRGPVVTKPVAPRPLRFNVGVDLD